MEFKVHTDGGDDGPTFEGKDRYEVLGSGALVVETAGRKITYSPTAWVKVVESVDPTAPATRPVG